MLTKPFLLDFINIYVLDKLNMVCGNNTKKNFQDYIAIML